MFALVREYHPADADRLPELVEEYASGRRRLVHDEDGGAGTGC
jgi:hypothetical protein